MDALVLPQSAGIPTVEEILGRMEAAPSEEMADLIRRAYAFAEDAHQSQFRKSGDPYFSHCARVAWLLAGTVNDPITVAAGLLHDTVEDCNVSVEKLSSTFSSPIGQLVDGVTKISALNFSTDQEHQASNLRKMILAMARDVRVVLIKLCDRLHNMQTLEFLPPARQRAIAQSTLDIFAPLANRLGMSRMRALLEDLAMKYLCPAVYERLKEKTRGREQMDQRIVDMCRQVLQRHLEEQHNPAIIQGRRKHLYSIHQKMMKQGLTFEEVYDILAMRVITDTIQECYEILGIVHTIWKPIAGRFKDYIASPKENGYQSIHTTTIGVDGHVTEVQIRTHRMHEIGEEGIAAHWKYKEDVADGHKQADQERLNWLRQLVDWLQDVRDPSEFVQDLKRDVFEDAVFCYTPRGDIIEMPRGSTALDLAYRIHTDVGHSCAGAKINHRMAPIRSQLQTGDIVEILTSKSSHPTSDWLQVTHTGRARNKIRQWLKANQHDEFLELGRRMLAERVRRRFGGSLDEPAVAKLLEPSFKQFSVRSFDDLLVEVGCGTIKLSSLVGRLGKATKPAPPKHPRKARRVGRRPNDIILVDGMAGAIVRRALCCSPLPGDSIVGFVTQGRGISIHKAECRSLANIRQRAIDFESRQVPVAWGEAGHGLKKAAIRLICHDRKGLLSDVSGVIAQMNINITATESTSNLRDNRAIIKLQLMVEHADQLNLILNRLAEIPGVQSLSRVVHSTR